MGTTDLVAQNAKYHRNCLTELYNRERRAQETTTSESSQEAEMRALALAELVSYIEESKDPELSPVFRLADLMKMYTNRLEQMGVILTNRPNSTRLKEKILQMVPGLRAHSEGKSILIMFEEDIGQGIKRACDQNLESDAIVLAKAAEIVRRDMFDMKYNFSGTFQEKCQEDSVPEKLKALVDMILEGPNIKNQTENDDKSAGLTISQLIMFNSVKHKRREESKSKSIRHQRNRETPFPIYMSLLIHSQTRSRELIEKFNSYGICIGYKRLLTISTELANRVCNFYHNENVVCPPHLKSGLFTTGAVDNIDHNTSSRSAKDTFHGTAISLTQHPTIAEPGNNRGLTAIYDNNTSTTKIRHLPEAYTEITPAGLVSSEYTVPKTHHAISPGRDVINNVLDEEDSWLEQMVELCNQQEIKEGEYMVSLSCSTGYSSCPSKMYQRFATSFQR